jgi:hypothetical protein
MFSTASAIDLAEVFAFIYFKKLITKGFRKNQLV